MTSATTQISERSKHRSQAIQEWIVSPSATSVAKEQAGPDERNQTYSINISRRLLIQYAAQVAHSLDWSIISESSTDLLPLLQDVEENIQQLFHIAKDEIFEDGMESEFSRDLIYYISRFGDDAMEAITRIIVSMSINAEIVSECLRWLGRIEHPETCNSRLWLLEHSLNSLSARIRDGALLGLASLDDPMTIPYLRQAIKHEPVEELKEDMKQVLAQLEETLHAVHSEKNTEVKVVQK